MACLRINDSFLASAERKALYGLVRRLPARATPDHLTAIGLAGAFLTAVGFIACRWSIAGLALVVVGMFLNWFGDSLDGTLARFRQIERQHYGFFIDHSADLRLSLSSALACRLSSPFRRRCWFCRSIC